MNIAVLIGISNYRLASPLPACEKDVAEMRRLLSATKKYDDVFCISTNTDAAPLKDTLRAFFARHQASKPVQEAFVYFSGHGTYQEDVLLCCSDFDQGRPKSTAVTNEELDDLLRSVEPHVAVKVLDACQSGSQYIKDMTPGFEKTLRDSRLKSFICMASSKTDQSSYATAECSFFTAHFIEAALSRAEGTVLYRDIQAALADAFVPTPAQTPYFVTQGTGLEVFAPVTPEMRALDAQRTAVRVTDQPGNTLSPAITEQIQKLDKLYVSEEDASHAIQRARESLDRAAIPGPLVSQFYEKRVSFDAKLTNLPSRGQVATFADQQDWDKRYFLHIGYRPSTLAFPAGLTSSGAISPLLAVNQAEYIESTQALPFEVAEVRFEPKGHRSLKSFCLYIGLAHSLTELLVLSAIARLVEVRWKERSVDLSQLKWSTQSWKWKDVVEYPDLVWTEPLKRAQETVQAYLEELAPKKDEAPAQAAKPN